MPSKRPPWRPEGVLQDLQAIESRCRRFGAMIGSRDMTNTILGAGALVASIAISFIVFVSGRYLAAILFRVPGRIAPFGEAPGASYKAARTGASLAIAVAGPAAVYLCSAAITTLGLLLQGETFLGGTLVNVVPSKPAHAAGMLDNDKIISINGAPVSSWDEMSSTVRVHPGEALDIAVLRGGQEIHLTVTPGEKGSPSEGKIGVTARPSKVTVGAALGRGLTAPLSVLDGMRKALGGTEQADLAGPVVVVREAGRAFESSGHLLVFMGALLSMVMLPYAVLGSLLLVPFQPGRAPLEKERNKDGDGLPFAPPRKARTGRRLWARVVDWIVFGTVVVALSTLVGVGPSGDYLRGPVLLLLWIPVEALLLSTVGFTLGKWLLGIVVQDAGGRRLSFRVALRRSAGVFAWGLALGSAISCVTALIAQRRLRRRGATYWDELDALEVHEVKVRVWRVVTAAIGLALGLIAVALSLVA